MARQVNVRTDKDHREALDAMQEDSDADSRAEAMRQTSRTELARRGYLNGHSNQTTLRKATHLMARWFTIAGFVLLGVTWWYPVSFRIVVVAPIVSAAFLFGVERVLATVEPGVSNKIRGLFGGETV